MTACGSEEAPNFDFHDPNVPIVDYYDDEIPYPNVPLVDSDGCMPPLLYRPPVNYQNVEVLAPMVRACTLPLRLECLKYGADLVYTEEMIDKKLVNARRHVNKDFGTVDYLEKLPNRALIWTTCAALGSRRPAGCRVSFGRRRGGPRCRRRRPIWCVPSAACGRAAPRVLRARTRRPQPRAIPTASRGEALPDRLAHTPQRPSQALSPTWQRPPSLGRC